MLSLYFKNAAAAIQKAFSIKDELLWFMLGQVFNLGANFYIIKSISNIGKQDFGEYVLILTISALLGFIIFGPAQQGFVRFFYKSYEENTLPGLISTFKKFIMTIAAVILISGITAYMLLFINNAGSIKELVLYGSVFIVFSKVSEFYNVSLNIIRQRKLNSILQICEKTIVILCLSIMAYMKLMSLYSVLIALSCIFGIFAVVKFYQFNKLTKEKFLNTPKGTEASQPYNVKELLIYAAPFLLWGISAWLQQNGEKWIMVKYLSIIDVGLYGVLITVVNMLVATPNTLLNDFMSPIIFNKFANLSDKNMIKSGEQFIRITNLLIAGIVGLSVVLTYFGGDMLIRLFSNKSYTSLSGLLPLFTVGTGLFYIGQTMCNKGMAFNKPKVYLLPKIILGVISIGLNFIFILKVGVSGVAYASIISSSVYVAHIYFINRRFKV